MNMPFRPAAAQLIDGHPRADVQQNLGEVLLNAGKLSAPGAERVSQLQEKEHLRFGEAAIKLGLITQADLYQALSHQFSYPYLSPGENHFSPELVAAYQPFGSQVERLRALRSQLMMLWFTVGHKALTIASINPGDGASYLAANLAIVFSQLGERTLLIDADLRQPRQHMLFNLGNRQGLSDVLARRAGMSAIARIPAFINLSVLTAGAVPPNPSELLSRSASPLNLDELAQHYDVILIDTAPARISADAVAVASRTQGALLVLRQDHTQLAAAAAFQANLRGVGTTLIGTVLNQF